VKGLWANKMTTDKLLPIVQNEREFVQDYIERFHNLSLMCPTGIPLPMLLQTCMHNFLNRVEVLWELSKLIP